MDNTKYHCQRCEKTLDTKKIVWLELSTETGEYHKVGEIPESESQGLFPFGRDCAETILGEEIK